MKATGNMGFCSEGTDQDKNRGLRTIRRATRGSPVLEVVDVLDVREDFLEDALVGDQRVEDVGLLHNLS